MRYKIRSVFNQLGPKMLLAFLSVLFFVPLTAHASFPKLINYQVRLMDSGRTAVSNNSYNVKVRLYTASTGGSPIWTEEYSDSASARVSVSNGLFSLLLGSVTPLDSVDFNQPLYLSLEIGGSSATPVWDGEMSPRKMLGAAPSAIEAFHASSSDYADNGFVILNPNSMAGQVWTQRPKITVTNIYYGVAVSSDGQFQTINEKTSLRVSSDYGNTWTNRKTFGVGKVAMSSDGKIQTAAAQSSGIYVSGDYGVTWAIKYPSTSKASHVAMSSDGQIQTVLTSQASTNSILVSNDYGNNWSTASTTNKNFYDVAMSSDGRIQTAVSYRGYIYQSSDYGLTWTNNLTDKERIWGTVSMSADGRIQLVGENCGYIYMSSDYGVSWTAQNTRSCWYDSAMSADGQIQTAVSYYNPGITTSGYVYVSNNYGSTWTSKIIDTQRYWMGISMSADGLYQTAVGNACIYTSGHNLFRGQDNLINLSIGTTSPAVSQMWVSGGTTIGSGFNVLAPTNGLLVQGSVGIGTTTSISTLTVGGGLYVSSSTLLAATTTSLGNLFSRSNAYVVENSYSDVTLLGSYANYDIVDGFSTSSMGSIRKIMVSGDYLYAIGQLNNTLQIYNISNPSNITLVATSGVEINSPYGITKSGNTAYVANFGSNSLSSYDVTNPASPTFLSSTTVTTGGQDVVVSGNYAYVVAAWSSANSGYFKVVDVSNPAAMNVVYSTTTGSQNCRGIDVSGNYAYVTCEGVSYVDVGSGGSNTDGKFLIYNISVPAAPTLVFSTTGTERVGDMRDVVVSGNYTYVTNLMGNLLIYDISSPSSPVLKSDLDLGVFKNSNNTPSWISYAGGNLYIANQRTAFQVVSVVNPSSPYIVKTLNPSTINPSSSYTKSGVWAVGNRFYGTLGMDVSVYGNGLYIYDTTYATAYSANNGLGGTDGRLVVWGNSTTTSLFNVLNNEQNLFTINGLGRVGIGSSSPSSLLVVAGTSTLQDIISTGSIGLGTTTPSAKLDIWGDLKVSTGTNPILYVSPYYNRIGIGTSTLSATATLTIVGTTRLASLGAGTITSDAFGNLTVSSDIRLKEVSGTFTRGLNDLLNLEPIRYHWNATSGLDTLNEYVGFSAQNVQLSIPEAVGTSSAGYLTLSDRPILAAVVNAVKELASTTLRISRNVIGIFDRVETSELCVGETCISEKQLKALLQNCPSSDCLSIPSQATNLSPVTTPSTPNASSTEESTTTPEAVIEETVSTSTLTPPVDTTSTETIEEPVIPPTETETVDPRGLEPLTPAMP